MQSEIIGFSSLFLGLALGLICSKSVPNTTVLQTKRRRRKKKQIQISPPQRSSIGPIPHDLQKEETSALLAIFLEDMSVLKAPDNSFKIFLKPTQNPKESYCSLYLYVTYPTDYPNSPPVLILNDIVNISKENTAEIKTRITQIAAEKSKNSQCMIYDVCELIQFELAKLNIPPEPLRIANQIEKKTKEDSGLVDEIYGELRRRKKSKETQDLPIQLNDLCSMKTISKEFSRNSRNFEPTISHTMSGFDYKRYFEEEIRIGRGGGGSVYKARNKIDGGLYAIKKIKLEGKKQHYIRSLLKEVVLLSRLQHQNVVRYHNAWFEDDNSEDSDSSSEEEISFSSEGSEISERSEDIISDEWNICFERSGGHIEPAIFNEDFENKPRKLYIQMEYCSGDTLRSVLDEKLPCATENWKMLREILQALSYIHSKGTIHRDLKPANIFLGSNGEVKLGDFGLATTIGHKIEKTGHKKPTPESFSIGIGTPLYCSPEQSQSGKYDQKADIYSIGIIFFEMWREFGSMMQRSDEIIKLREKHELPQDFLKNVPNEVVKIILWLTEILPENRPSAQELLQSGLLLHTIDPKVFNEFLHHSLKPKTIENFMLLAAIFDKPNSEYVQFTYNLTESLAESSIKKNSRKIETMVKNYCVSKMKNLMDLAGIIDVEAPLIYPYSKNMTVFNLQKDGNYEKNLVDSNELIAKFMELSGTIVQLSNNQVVPWARVLAKKDINGILKRYNIGNMYRAHGSGEQPESELEMSIDYCYDPDLLDSYKYWFEAELIKISQSCLDQFSIKLPMIELAISDSRILDIILNHCEVPFNIRIKVLALMNSLHRRKWANVLQDLSVIGIRFSTAEKLKFYFKMKDKRERLMEILRKDPIWKNNNLCKILDIDMRHLEEACKDYGINIDIDFGLIPDEILYYSGLLFKFSCLQTSEKSKNSDRVLIATGGRYDNLISHFAFPEKMSKTKATSGIGVRIFLEKIISLINQTNIDQFLRGPQVLVSYKSYDPRPDFKSIFTEKINLTLELWKNGISALYEYGQQDEEDLLETCKKYRIRFWITIKEANSEKRIKIRDFAKDPIVKTIERQLVIKYIQDRLKSHTGEIYLLYPHR